MISEIKEKYLALMGRVEMFCKYCGEEIDDHVLKCKHCGSKTPKAKKKTESRIAITLLILLLLGCAITAGYFIWYESTREQREFDRNMKENQQRLDKSTREGKEFIRNVYRKMDRGH